MKKYTIAEIRIKFRGIFPEFNKLSDDKIDYYIGFSLIIFDTNVYGVIYLTAHYISIAQSSDMGSVDKRISVGGTEEIVPIKRFKVEDKDVTFSNSYNQEDIKYSTTPYGIMYLEIKNAKNKVSFPALIS